MKKIEFKLLIFEKFSMDVNNKCCYSHKGFFTVTLHISTV